MPEKTLNFMGPFSMISEKPRFLFDDDIAQKPGIYMWTIKGRNGYLVDYVGETGKNIQSRFLVHFQAQFTGKYNIFEPDKLKKGERSYLWRGYHWRKNEIDEKVKDFFRNTEEHLSQIITLFREYKIFVASIRTTQRIRKRIETGIINELLKNEIYSKGLQNPPQLRTSLKPNEKPIKYRIISKEKIIGFSEIIIV